MTAEKGPPANVNDLHVEVMDYAGRVDRLVWTDLEAAGLGGRCPWKRLGELEVLGELAIVDRVRGKYGRQVNVYQKVAKGANCRSGCNTRDHKSWGECARAAGVQVGRLN